jgi:hypothetical protein
MTNSTHLSLKRTHRRPVTNRERPDDHRSRFRVQGRSRPVLETQDGLVKGETAGRLPIVMGLDQHRAQITAEWIDLATGEISRGRVAPADRAAVRRFLARSGDTGSRSRWRRPRAGGSWSRSSTGSAPGCTWPSRRRRAVCVGRRSARRPPGPTPGIYPSCFRLAGCRSRGSRLVTSSISAPRSAGGTR